MFKRSTLHRRANNFVARKELIIMQAVHFCLLLHTLGVFVPIIYILLKDPAVAHRMKNFTKLRFILKLN